MLADPAPYDYTLVYSAAYNYTLVYSAPYNYTLVYPKQSTKTTHQQEFHASADGVLSINDTFHIIFFIHWRLDASIDQTEKSWHRHAVNQHRSHPLQQSFHSHVHCVLGHWITQLLQYVFLLHITSSVWLKHLTGQGWFVGSGSMALLAQKKAISCLG